MWTALGSHRKVPSGFEGLGVLGAKDLQQSPGRCHLEQRCTSPHPHPETKVEIQQTSTSIINFHSDGRKPRLEGTGLGFDSKCSSTFTCSTYLEEQSNESHYRLQDFRVSILYLYWRIRKILVTPWITLGVYSLNSAVARKISFTSNKLELEYLPPRQLQIAHPIPIGRLPTKTSIKCTNQTHSSTIRLR